MSPETVTATPAAGASPTPAAAATPTPAAPAAAALGEGAWLTELPPELQKDPTLAGYKSLADLAKGHIETKKLVGGSVRIPGDKATAQEIASFRTKLGVPENPDGYALTLDEALPWDVEGVTSFKRIFHEAGIPAKAAQQIIDGYADYATAQQEKLRATFTAAHEGLKKEWGEALYTRRHAAAFALIDKYADPETKAWLDATGLGNHPGIFQMLAPIGEQFLEDQIITTVGGGVGTDTAKDQIKAIRGDKAHAFNQPGTLGHAAAVEHMNSLYKIAYGTGAPE